MQNTNDEKWTPMFEQYWEVKNSCKDTLLFYRMGDFYELFFDDAILVARELQLALTNRSRNPEISIPMCGVPWHAVDAYISQLVSKGYSLAICDQVEDPKQAKGLVRREITKIITPGTTIDDTNLRAGEHTYLGSLFFEEKKAGFIWADVSTGQWTGLEGDRDSIWQWVIKISPAELLLQEEIEIPKDSSFGKIIFVRKPKLAFDSTKAKERLFSAQKVQDLASLGLEKSTLLVRAAGALLGYLSQTQKRDPSHLLPFRPFDTGKHLIIDDITEKNLEIFVRLNGSRGKGTLRHCLDLTMTPMGGRLLEERLRSPLRETSLITKQLDAVEFFVNHNKDRALLRDMLKGVFDLERLSTRIHMNRALPKDFAALRNSLSQLPQIKNTLLDLQGEKPELLETLLTNWESLQEEYLLLERALLDPPANSITEGGIFKFGFTPELDTLIDLSEHGETKLSQLLAKDQEKTGLKLKLGNNRIFGYYYEVSKGQKAALPDTFIRRQTLANGERYTTEELQQLEEEITQAEEKKIALEYKLFQALRERMANIRPRILTIASQIAQLDLWLALAEKARCNTWTRPTISNDLVIRIQEGRHPVIEESIGKANFVPNTLSIHEKRRFCLLTGPNMAGKSTILRQTAIICLMAQMGSFVPAESAELGIVDRIFSRVGASDNIAQGQSTFMVEMMETARILRQSTRRSLIILDEIGRGTSTYDGLALAWAVSEELSQRFGGSLRTLFATHYHELTQLEGQLPGVFTMSIAIKEFDGKILFLHKLLSGPTDRSYGVEVARLAGIPKPIVNRAKELLKNFEDLRRQTRKAVSSIASPNLLPGLCLETKSPEKETTRIQAEFGKEIPAQEREHPLIEALSEIETDQLSPMAALKLICEWKKIWGKEQK